uniref:Uncharacterized protein n=1 Tax=Arundo donax TaxID=35708 RepID=A0A0A9F1D7_ARUDO
MPDAAAAADAVAAAMAGTAPCSSSARSQETGILRSQSMETPQRELAPPFLGHSRAEQS